MPTRKLARKVVPPPPPPVTFATDSPLFKADDDLKKIGTWGSKFKALSENKGLKIIHINIRSLLQKIDQLRIIASLGNVDIISVNETFLDSTITNDEVDIGGYELYRKDRGTRHGGGVALYIRSNLPHEACEHLSTLTDAEVCWVKVKPKCQKPLSGEPGLSSQVLSPQSNPGASPRWRIGE